MSPALVLIGVILALGIWGYLQQGDLLYIVNKLSASDIATYASNAGFPDVVTAVAIALAESGGDPSAVGDKTLAPTNGPSIGLWQINIGSKANPQYANANLTDPQTNANAAYAIYVQQGFQAWSTFNGGQYLNFMQTAQDAVQS
jgi:Lysozyme like domain